MSFQSATIILNPVSGQGDPKLRKKQIIDAARKYGWKGKLVETTPDALANNAAMSEYRKGQRNFVICGGDGTIIEAIEALVNKEAVLGIVPLGTGNLLAKNLNLPIEISDAMRIALKGKSQKIDIGQANRKFFAIMAGMGLDAVIMEDTSRRLKSWLGLSAYYITAIRKLGYKPVRYELEIDGVTQQFKAKTVVIANMGKISQTLEVVPNTSPYDGTLKVGIIKSRSLSQFFDIALAAVRGNINQSRYFSLLEGKNIQIRSLGGAQPYQCDGNNFPATKKLEIIIHPHAISLMVAS